MSEVAEMRAFNRFYTRQIGLLDEHYSSSRFSLAEGRLLYELSTRGHATGAELGRIMGVDRAYIHRLLQKFVAEELVAVRPNISDRRSNVVALTEAGKAASTEIDTNAGAAVEALLAPLDPMRRQALLAAMRTIQGILGIKVEPGPVILRGHRIGELGWLVHRQGLLYNQQYGWNIEFEALIAGIYSEYETAASVPPKGLWIAEQDRRVVGSIFAMPSEDVPGSAQLRMLYVEPEARGYGIGKVLVDQCVAFARDAGYERMRLWTHSVQHAARTLYAKAGFAVAEEFKHHAFGKDLEAEIWELRF